MNIKMSDCVSENTNFTYFHAGKHEKSLKFKSLPSETSPRSFCDTHVLTIVLCLGHVEWILQY
jgi:hypothetical protein